MLLGLSFFISFNTYSQGDASSDLPGAHFSLEGALELFKEAKSPEDFEKSLNDPDQLVNNLDLNADDQVDYIRVEDHMEGEVHAIVLQVPVSEDEVQDIAVIEIEKKNEGEAILQIIGDEDIFGQSIIVEPFEETAGEGQGPDEGFSAVRIVANVWLWPSVRHIYRPRYAAWISPWRWRVYPRWWSPWRPHPLGWYHARRPHLHRHFHVVDAHRVVNAHRIYIPQRRVSVTVKARHQPAINRYRSSHRVTSSKVVHRAGSGTSVQKTKTTVARKAGGNTSVQRQQTTIARGSNGAVRGTSTTNRTKVNKTRTNGSVQQRTTKVKHTPQRKGTVTTRRTKTVKKKGGKR